MSFFHKLEGSFRPSTATKTGGSTSWNARGPTTRGKTRGFLSVLLDVHGLRWKIKRTADFLLSSRKMGEMKFLSLKCSIQTPDGVLRSSGWVDLNFSTRSWLQTRPKAERTCSKALRRSATARRPRCLYFDLDGSPCYKGSYAVQTSSAVCWIVWMYIKMQCMLLRSFCRSEV